MSEDLNFLELVHALHTIPGCNGIDSMQLINLDWSLIELIFSSLFSELDNITILELTIQREKQRRTDTHRDRELEYREKFTQEILKELKSLGYSNASLHNIQPNLLITNRKLCLKWISFLVDCVQIIQNSKIPLETEFLPQDDEICQAQIKVANKTAKPSSLTKSKSNQTALKAAAATTKLKNNPSSTGNPEAAEKTAEKSSVIITKKPSVPQHDKLALDIKEPFPSQSTAKTSKTAAATTVPPNHSDKYSFSVQQTQSVVAAQAPKPVKKPINIAKPQSLAQTSDISDELKSRDELLFELQALRTHYSELNSVYSQLIGENSREKHNSRRVNLLKAQNMQLERQVLLLTDAVNSRATILQETQGLLLNLQGNLQDVSRSFSGYKEEEKAVGAASNAAKFLIAQCDSTMQRIQQSNRYQLNLPQNYIKHSKANNSTNVSENHGRSGLNAAGLYNPNDLGHLNLERVHELEGKLTLLFEQLKQMKKKYLSAAWLAVESQHLRHIAQNSGSASQFPGFVEAFEALMRSAHDCTFELLSLAVVSPSIRGNSAAENRGNSAVERYYKARERELELELELYRASIQLQRRCTQKLFERVENIITQFDAANNNLYSDIVTQLDECINDWQRNSTHHNINKLLSIMASVIPSIKSLLAQDQDTSSASHNKPSIIIAFERELNGLMQEYDAQMSLLSQQQYESLQLPQHHNQYLQQQQQIVSSLHNRSSSSEITNNHTDTKFRPDWVP
jgi:hypothetical protein